MRRLLLTLALQALAACGSGGGARDPSIHTGLVSSEPVAAAKSAAAAATIRRAARPILGTGDEYADILGPAGSARRVLLGESTHGTHEYYRARGRISERLVLEHGVQAIAIEGDWTPTFRVNLYVRGLGTDRSADQALQDYTSFPRWMWPNTAFRDFIERLRAINMSRPAEQRVGVYGMDVYALFNAADQVVAHLRQVNPGAAQRVSRHYQCFARYNRETDAYGEASRTASRRCDDEAAAAVREVSSLPRPSGAEAAERHFGMVRNAISVTQAEEYFYTAYSGTNAWNVRDRGMERNVEDIAGHVGALSGRPGKVVMWAHNSHVGDARATSAANRGELNIGQLMRHRHGDAAMLIGFFSHSGTVFAAPDWGAAGRVYEMRPALPGSHSDLFRQAGMPAFSLLLRGNAQLKSQLSRAMPQRAIGVIYVPQTERQSHYFDARLAEQFDAVVFFERSNAVAPLRQ